MWRSKEKLMHMRSFTSVQMFSHSHTTHTNTHTRAHFYTEMIWHWAALRAVTITNRVAFTKEWIYTRSFYIQMFYTGILCMISDGGRVRATRVQQADVKPQFTKAFGDRDAFVGKSWPGAKPTLQLHFNFWRSTFRASGCVSLTSIHAALPP